MATSFFHYSTLINTLAYVAYTILYNNQPKIDKPLPKIFLIHRQYPQFESLLFLLVSFSHKLELMYFLPYILQFRQVSIPLTDIYTLS